MLITEEYRKLNAQLHKDRPDYGVGGHKYVAHIKEVARKIGAHTILDYGCGKRMLEKALGYAINNYDPAIPGVDATPEPADLVVCTDVLEHIEPDNLDDVLDDLKRVTKNTLVLTVATRTAKKFLADGRNAHLIEQPAKWWLPRIMDRFELIQFSANQGEFLCFAEAHGVRQ